LAFRNPGFGLASFVRRERPALINRFAKGAICPAPNVALVSSMWFDQFALARCLPLRRHYPLSSLQEKIGSRASRGLLFSGAVRLQRKIPGPRWLPLDIPRLASIDSQATINHLLCDKDAVHQ
jgi:hypothetical protein